MTKPPVVYDPNAVLDYEQLAAGLNVGIDTARKMDLPFFMAGARERFIWGQVLDTLRERARNNLKAPTRMKLA